MAFAGPVPVFHASFDKDLTATGSGGAMQAPLLSDGISYTAGRGGGAAHFVRETHSYVRYPSGILNPEQGTVSLWVRLNTASGDLGMGYRTIINIGGNKGTNLIIQDNRLKWGQLNTQWGSVGRDRLGWKAEEWHHVAAVWHPDSSDPSFPYRYWVALYVDGVCTASGISCERPWPRGDLNIGSFPVPSYGKIRNFELEGDVDDLKVYAEPLTQAQVVMEYGEKVIKRASSTAGVLPVRKPVAKAAAKPSLKMEGAALDSSHPCAIVIDVNASAEERLAAKEISSYLKEIAGVNSTVSAKPDAGAAAYIFIGTKSAAGTGMQVPELEEDEAFISCTADRLFLAGGGREGIYYAADELLERLGVRWYAPGREGTLVPRLASVRLPVGVWREKPFFTMRASQGCMPHNQEIRDIYDWIRHTRGHGDRTYGKMHRMVTKELRKILPDSLFNTHPEYFGMDDRGVRGVPSKNSLNPCTSNPEVVRTIVETAVGLLKDNPDASYFTIEPIDGGGWCQCPACKAMDSEPGNYTDRVVILGNAIADAVSREFPGKGKGARFFAYQGYSYPPSKVTPAANMQVEITRSDPELLASWARQCSNLQRWSYYGYWTYHWSPMPGMGRLASEARLMKELGFKGWFNEGTSTVFQLGVPHAYIMSKLMWNPDADIPALLADFFSGYYGRASKPMRASFDLLEAQVDRQPPFTNIDFDPLQCPPGVWKECISLAEDGERLASGDPWTLRHVKIAKLSYIFGSLARDVRLAKQYSAEAKHPFWKDLGLRREEDMRLLTEGIHLAQELGITQVRSTVEDPGTLETLAAVFASTLGLDIERIQRIFTGESAVPGTGEWVLAFEDDFKNDSLAADWVVREGQFSISGGALLGRGEIYVNRKFPGDQKLEYEASASRNDGLCDLSAVLGAAGKGYSGAYFFGFGSNGNAVSKLMKGNSVLFSSSSPLIIPEKRHHIVCEKSGNRVVWWVDGERLTEFNDIRPASGDQVGLYIYSPARVEYVKVYVRNGV